jgi:hypothetical protein
VNTTKRIDSDKKKGRDPDFINAEIALKRAAQKARRRAAQAGVGVIVVKDGQIVEEEPDNMHASESVKL